ncbi:MAG: hypothetical protein AAGA85_04000 [Bacteroidota bacterium]
MNSMRCQRVLFIHLLQAVPESLSGLETALGQMALESLTVDNRSAPELIAYAEQFLAAEGELCLAIWREDGASWGSAQPLLRSVMKRAHSIYLLANTTDPMLSKLEGRLAGYLIVDKEQEMIERFRE